MRFFGFLPRLLVLVVAHHRLGDISLSVWPDRPIVVVVDAFVLLPTSSSSSSSKARLSPIVTQGRVRGIPTTRNTRIDPIPDKMTTSLASSSTIASIMDVHNNNNNNMDTMNPDDTTTTMILTSLDVFVQNPVTWSVAIMLTIVGLLFVWEGMIETARKRVPAVVGQVIDQVLTEMGSLGFIGLFLDTAVLHQPAVRQGLVQLSQRVLGDPELLLETFEFLHQVFFQTAILFFAGAALLIVKVIDTLKTVADLADKAVMEAQGDTTTTTATSAGEEEEEAQRKRIANQEIVGIDGNGRIWEQMSSMDYSEASDHDAQDLVAILLLQEAARQQKPQWIHSEMNGTENVWQREASLTMKQRGAECVIIRERLIREMGLEGSFRIADYLENGVFAQSLSGGGESEKRGPEEGKGRFDFIEISPAVWIPLIPSVALANALDLSHDVVNAESANAIASSGYFVSTPWVFWPTLLTQIVTLIWGLTNFYKMAAIKQMLLPGLADVSDSEEETIEPINGSNGTKRGNFVLYPPMVEDDILRKNFSDNRATPIFARPFEEKYQTPATNRIEELYGVVGGSGEEFYFNSIKFHLWKCATGWIAFSQVLPRDLYALSYPSDSIGAPDYLVAEILVFGLFAFMDLFQATTLVPTTVLNYCIITTVADFVSKEKQNQAHAEQSLTTQEP